MDYATISSLIQTVGFPAVCVLGMGWYVKYITDQHHEDLQKMQDQHRQEMNDVTQALNNNTLALQKLADYITLGGDNGDVKGN